MSIGPRTGGGLISVLIVVAVVLITDVIENRDTREESGMAAGSSVIAEVERIVDGDTAKVNFDGRSETVRYIGIDTPESVKPDSPVECFGEEASRFNERLVEGKSVRLVFDRELRDRFGRLLAYVYVGDTFVNAELVSGGYARTLEIEPNTSKAEQLARLESAAGSAGRGLWSSC